MAGAEKNKVKYNLKNVHYAKATITTDGAVSYGTPVALPGAVSIALDASGEPNIFYADGYAYYITNNNHGYDGDLEIALIPDSFRQDILGDTLTTDKVLVENANAQTNPFALMFEFDGDVKAIRHVLYNCAASRPNIEGETKEEEVEVKTETLSLKASPLKSGMVKAKTTEETTSNQYDEWYTTVYMPSNA